MFFVMFFLEIRMFRHAEIFKTSDKIINFEVKTIHFVAFFLRT